jgi:hypothetical protein
MKVFFRGFGKIEVENLMNIKEINENVQNYNLFNV